MIRWVFVLLTLGVLSANSINIPWWVWLIAILCTMSRGLGLLLLALLKAAKATKRERTKEALDRVDKAIKTIEKKKKEKK